MTRDLYVSVAEVGKYEPLTTALQRREAMHALSAYVIDPQDVPTDGYVVVKITDCVNLVCHALSGGPQPVVKKDHPVYWVWAISTRKPGPAMIVLDEKLYKGSTGKTLAQTLPIQISLNVRATKGYQQHKKMKAHGWFDNVEHVILGIGALCTALVAIIGLLELIFRPIRSARERRRQEVEPTPPSKG